MALRISRIILIARNVPALAKFYQDLFGLRPKGPLDSFWMELLAGGISLAFHRGTPPRLSRGIPKVVFWCRDVIETRERLAKKGVSLNKVRSFGGIQLCDGKDPEGNVFQLSSRP